MNQRSYVLSHKGIIPSSWSITSLREIGVWRGGGTPSKAIRAFWTNGIIPWVSPKDMKIKHIACAEDRITPEAVESSATSLINAGSILIVTRSGILSHTLPVAINDVDVALNQDLKALTPDAGIDVSYVAHALDRFEREILHQCTKTGTTVPSIEFPLLLDFEIPLAPLSEQRRIVAEIEKQFARLEECTEALRRVAEDLKQYRASVLKAACEGRLVPTEAELARAEGRDYEPASVLLERILAERRVRWEADQLARMKAQDKAPKDEKWKERYEEPEEPTPGHILELPEGWCIANVIQLGFVASGQTPKGIENSAGDGSVSWFRVSDMNAVGNEKIMRQAQVRLTEEEISKLKLNVQPSGTIVFPKRGGAISTNKKRTLAEPSAYDLNLMGISPLDVVADYLWHWFSSIDLGRLSDGSNVPQINHGDIEPLCVPLPPLAEQHRIVAEVERRLYIVDELEELVSVNLEHADELRRSILKRAFEGRLVSQDPNDEPVAALLERIAAERQRRAEEAMTQKKSSTDKRRNNSPEAESTTPLFAEERIAAQSRELLTAFTKKEDLTIEDLFRHGGYSFDSEDDKDIDAFFENLTGELEAARLTLERKDNDDVFIKRGAV